jgi:hypothetical protein
MAEIMDRRLFFGLLGGAGLAQAASLAQPGAGRRTRLYLMQRYYLRAGNQLARLNEYLEKTALPALSKVHAGPKIVLEGLIVPHTPELVLILGFSSVEEFWSVRGRLNQDEQLEKAFEAWQAGPEPPFERQENVLLEATDYSPEIAAADPPPKAGRIFELRVYHSPSYTQLRHLHERFAGPEIKIFHRVGVHPILYASTIIGPNMPNLTYLTPFDDLAAREKAWNAFGADPEWIKVRQQSVDAYGQVTKNNLISIYRATPYSPVR